MTDTYKEMLKGVDHSLAEYIEGTIIPRYASFDKAHHEDHARIVVSRALEMANALDAIDRNILYAAAACHDLGLAVDRATHHLESGRIIREDAFLLSFFGPEKLETVARAAEDHRASSKSEPRGIYGRLVAEADRNIEPYSIIRRTVQFGLDHYPELEKEGHWERTLQHLREKYGDGGYLHLWIPGSPNEAKLEQLRVIIRNPQALREVFERIWEKETKK